MSNTAHSELLAALSGELLAVRSFVELLQQEQRLLTENLNDQLLALAEQKSAFALRLNELAEARRRLLKKNLPMLTRESVRAWLTANSPEGLALWLEIITLAEQSQQLNRINGEVIQMKLRHNQQTLTALSRAVSNANLYGPDGQPSFSPGSGRSLGTV